jgi:hypothetical protein
MSELEMVDTSTVEQCLPCVQVECETVIELENNVQELLSPIILHIQELDIRTHTTPGRCSSQNATLYGNTRRKREQTLHDVNLPDLALRPLLAAQSTRRISHEAFFRPDLLVEDAQSLGAVYALVRQYYRTVFDDRFGMESVGHVAR